jgi:hypothetical protein
MDRFLFVYQYTCLYLIGSLPDVTDLTTRGSVLGKLTHCRNHLLHVSHYECPGKNYQLHYSYSRPFATRFLRRSPLIWELVSMGRTEKEDDSSTLTGLVAKLSQTVASGNLAVSNNHAPASPPAMVMPVPQSLPATKTRHYSIQNVPTHAFCQVFSDRIVVGITQLPSLHIGNWITCQATMSPVDPKAIEWDVATILGNHSDPLSEVYARRVVDCMIQKQCIPGTNHIAILLGISLQQTTSSKATDVDRERFHLIIQSLVLMIEESLEAVRFKSNKYPRC